jgi:iron complex outermembrane receptor protein
MLTLTRLPHRRLSRIMLLTTTLASANAIAQTAPADIGSVTANGTQPNFTTDQGPFAPPPRGSAADVAPSHAPLESGQPTSIVGKTFIDNSTIPAQNFDELVKFTPSLMNVQPAGPVSQQNYGESIRGFQYNQFNTTFDGLVLPGTVSNFAPQSATYFTSHDLGSVVVDRGPGTASTIGYATFGGTLALNSKEPSDVAGAQAYTTFGSFNQELFGLEVDSGAQPALGGGRGFLDYSRLTTDAYLTNVTTDRSNAFGKWEQPVGSSTLITFVGMINDSYGHTAYGSTIGQINTFGPDYGLNNNPRSQDFYGVNTDRYDTDFEYIRINSDLGGGWALEETPYTASYFRSGTEGADPNGTTANLGEPGGAKEYIDGVRIRPTDDVPAVSKHNDFRDWGSTTRITKDTPWGQLRAGLWFDYVSNSVYRTKVDYSRGNVVYTTSATAAQLNQQYHDRLVTAQPYIEFAWTPLPGLVITPGVKYTSVTRELDIGVLSGLPKGESNQTWNKAQPSVEARYKITPHWSVYGQVAKGFLAPPLSTLETTLPATVQPEETTNYQIGTVYQIDKMSLSGDLYYIPFDNFIASRSVDGNTLYFNEGGATYKGIELEGTYKIGGGLSAYGNGTLNDARYNNGAHIYQAPQRTAAAGLLFSRDAMLIDRDTVYGSILLKDVGKQFGENGTASDGPTAEYPIKSYSTIDLALGYTLPLTGKRKARFGLNFYNLLNNHSLIGFAGNTAAGAPLYWTDPGFSGFVTVSLSI